MEITYPQRHADLQLLLAKLAKELPAPVSSFARLHRDSVAQGTLPATMYGCRAYQALQQFEASAVSQTVKIDA